MQDKEKQPTSITIHIKLEETTDIDFTGVDEGPSKLERVDASLSIANHLLDIAAKVSPYLGWALAAGQALWGLIC